MKVKHLAGSYEGDNGVFYDPINDGLLVLSDKKFGMGFDKNTMSVMSRYTYTVEWHADVHRDVVVTDYEHLVHLGDL